MTMPGGGGPEFFERLLNDLIGLMGSAPGGGKNQLELARSFAHAVGTGGQPEPNVDPIARIELEELARIAEMHIIEITGRPVTQSATPLEIVTAGPGMWAWHTLEDWSFLLEAMSSPPAKSAGPPHREERERPANAPSDALEGLGLTDLGEPPPSDLEIPGGPAEVMARFISTMGPMLAAMQLGSAVGHLARTTLGTYELPVPRPSNRLLFVPQNIERFATDWSLPLDQVRLWICLRELTAHSVLSLPHVSTRLRNLISDVVRGMAEDASGVAGRLGDLDLTDADSMQRLLEDPEALFGTNPSLERKRASSDLEAVTAALAGYIEHVLDKAADRLLGGRGALSEAWRRRQHDREAADRAAELLLGLGLGTSQLERGVGFVEGVIERAGDEGLAMLWSAPRNLPTPAEVDAPGLWLERIRLSYGDPGSEA